MDENAKRNDVKTVLVYGPPGIGKSTIIDYMQQTLSGDKDYRTIDLEVAGVNRKDRMQIVSMERFSFVGAADLPLDFDAGENSIKVLLVLSQGDYDKRRSARDELDKSRGHQCHHEISDWIRKSGRDMICLDASGDVSTTVSKLIALRAGLWLAGLLSSKEHFHVG